MKGSHGASFVLELVA
jgi:hypothetical protein